MSGVAFATVGYFGIFGAGAVCDTLGVLYVAFVLKESIGPRAHPSLKRREDEEAEVSGSTTASPTSYGSTEQELNSMQEI